MSDAASAPGLLASRPDVIFHLAAIVSGEAEADLEKGYRINLDGTLSGALQADPEGGWRFRLSDGRSAHIAVRP